jgi:hypothetical protein
MEGQGQGQLMFGVYFISFGIFRPLGVLMASWYILQTAWYFFGYNFFFNCVILHSLVFFPYFGLLYQEKSGNPDPEF